ncbi:SMP-30/gluconolactonase/LRE family protein [Geobacter pelophilus]|uniref:SMP-30/gluconolactonase/LRE family protein n=1 Tax=Geoanaerobacter pelophilus TaxID=60036 RepID=A0AAW4L8M5_9BACT|nr:L-dopachrome tautomerase-related protein [Geoanaerobacter pelophilus]MBT0666497.1 SMP-30/gluconolactonase/LRE family protein [Geoanaerobacter pelophilus]
MNLLLDVRAGKIIYFLTLLLSLWGCATNPVSSNPILPIVHEALFEYPYFNDQVTGVAISHTGRVFVNFPRWDKDPLYSVAELLPDGSLHPYPDNDWNRWGMDEASHPESHFVCVQSVVVDNDDFLWVLDPASPGFKGVVSGGAKLVRINLATDTIERVIPFNDVAAPRNSYLNDVRVDPDGGIAYISDSGAGAIVVVDLTNGTSIRRLASHPSTKAEPGYVPVIGGKELRDDNGNVPKIHADGIAIDATGEYLYYHALTASTLYRIKTSALKDTHLTEEQLSGRVERVAVTGAIDGMLIDTDNNLYLTALEENAIKCYRPDGKIDTIIKDSLIQWPDSMDISTDGNLYFTASQIHRMPRFNYGKDERILPYKLFKFLLMSF